jgi:hypothetical protein
MGSASNTYIGHSTVRRYDFSKSQLTFGHIVILGNERTSQCVLGSTKDVPERDQDADEVQHVQKPLPREISLQASCGGSSANAFVEEEGNSQEDKEDNDLQSKTAKNDVLTHLVSICVVRRCLQSSTNELYEKAKYISTNEDLCQPGDSDKGIGLSIRDTDEPS